MRNNNKEAVVERFIHAIMGQESGGDWTAHNNDGSGCAGAFQFAQGTWDTYAAMAAPDYVGVDPAQAPPEVQMAVMYAKTSKMYDKYGGNAALMAVEHYGGEGAADYAASNGISDAPEYYNGAEYPSLLSYATQIEERMQGSAVPSRSGLFKANAGSKGINAADPAFPIIVDSSVYNQEMEAVMNNRPFADKLEDTFKNMWYGNSLIGIVRDAIIKDTHWGNRGYVDYTWKPSDEDLALMNEVLGNNQIAKNSVLLNSQTPEQFKAFLKARKEDIDRERRTEMTSFGMHSVIGGVGAMLLDPLNLVPFVGEASLLTKVSGRLGLDVLSRIGTQRVYRILETGAQQGMLNMADSYLSEQHGIHEANYAVAGLLGVASGVGIRLLTTMKYLNNGGITGENMTRAKAQIEGMQTEAVRNAASMGDRVAVSTDVALRRDRMSKLGEELSKHLFDQADEGRKISKAVHLTIRDIPTEGALDNLIGKETAKSNIYKGFTDIKDLISSTIGNPEMDRKVRKAVSNYQKNHMGDTAWEGYKAHVLGRSVGKDRTTVIAEYLQNPEKIIQLRKKLMLDTDEDVRMELKKMLYKESGVTYSDGATETIIINGAHVKKETPLHDAITRPEIYGDVPSSVEHVPQEQGEMVSGDDIQTFLRKPELGTKTLREVEKESQIGFQSRVMQFIGRKIQDSKYLGNTYGHFNNSVSNHLRDFGRKFLPDPRQNAGRKVEGMAMDFATMKNVAQRDLKQNMARMYDCYKEYFFNHPGTPTEVRKKFGKEFLACYDDKVKKGLDISEKYSKEVQEAVRHAENFRKQEQWLLRKAGLLSREIEDTGFYRSADIDKVADFITHFDSTEEATKWLSDYGYKNADRTALERWYKKAIQDGDYVGEEDFEGYVRQEADKWAYGIIDRNLSHARTEMRDLGHLNTLEQYIRRFPMDTSAVSDVKLPNGGDVWSFDDCMRDLDVFGTMTRIADRSSAQATLRSLGVQDFGKFFDEYRDKIHRELRKANENDRVINRQAVEDTMEEFDYVVSKLMGQRYGTRHSQDPMKDMGRLLTKLSYSMNGFNMGLNQINENMGLMSVTGARAITHMIPGLDKILNKFRHTTLTPEQIRNLRVAGDYAHYTFLNPMDLRRPQVDRIGLRAKVMAGLNDKVDYTSDFTSLLNRLSAWTEKAISMGEADVMSDLIDWSVGKLSNKKLFAADYLKEAGIRDIKKFKETVTKYFSNLDPDDPDAVFKAIQRMQNEDYAAYVSMRAFTQRAVQRGIIQPNIANDNYFSRKGNLMPILLQFKNFSRMALDSHLGRALERPDREALTQALSSGIAGAGIWAMRQWVYANYKYGNDDKKREEYLDTTLNPANFFRAGLTRSSMLAGLSFGNDVFEALSGAPTVRTTVARRENKGSWSPGGMIDQLPAFQSMATMVNGASSVWNAMHDLAVDHRVYQDDAKAITQMFPIDRFVGTQLFLSGLLDVHKGDATKDIPKRPSASSSPNNQMSFLDQLLGGGQNKTQGGSNKTVDKLIIYGKGRKSKGKENR